MYITCTDINCPERTGGKCQAQTERESLTADQKLEIIEDAKRYIAENLKDMPPEFAKTTNKNIKDMLWK